jgi:hypothetical protein
MMLWDSVLREAFLHREVSEDEFRLWLSYLEQFGKMVDHLHEIVKEKIYWDEEYDHLKSEIDGLEKDIEKVKRKVINSLIGSTFPSSESVVIFAFGRIYEQLERRLARVLLEEDRFDKITFRTQYPDVELTKGDKRSRIEFELHSRDFKTHSHEEKECDLIICWVHDWKNCPLKVFELRSLSMSEPS